MIRLIAAIDRQRGIGKDGKIPWSIPEDEQYFTDQTKTHGGIVLTGARTFRETYHGPLADRQNYILSRHDEAIEGAEVVHDLAKFLADFEGKDVWIAGGGAVFEQVMQAGKADELYLTHIDADFDCDRFFPEYEGKFQLAEQSKPHEQNGLHFYYARYTKII
jgi:dihydrofolate reductase